MALLPHWIQRFALTGTAYEAKFLPNHVYLTADWLVSDASTLLLTFLIGGAVYAGRGWLMRLGHRSARIATNGFTLLFAVYVLGFFWFLFSKAALRASYVGPTWLPDANAIPVLLHRAHVAYWLALALGVVWLVLKPRALDRLRLFIRALTPVFVALGLVTAANGVLAFAKLGWPARIEASAAAPVAGPSTRPRRVVWLIFDQLDASDAFGERDPTVQMPNFDGLVQNSLFFSNASSPHNGTQYAIPALLTGRRVATVSPQPNDLLVGFEGADELVPLSITETVFDRLHAAGVRVGVVAQSIPHGQLSIPYCRMLGDVLARCWNEQGWTPWSRDAIRSIGFVAGRLLEFASPPLAPPATLRQIEVRDGVAAYQRMVEAFELVAADPSLDLLVAHWMIPHYPHIYDRVAADFAWNDEEPSSEREGYLNNLALTDRTLGLILQSLRRTEVGRGTIVVVTGDHGNQRDVPLIVHIPGHEQSMLVRRPVSTLGLGATVEALMAGRLASYSEAAASLAEEDR